MSSVFAPSHPGRPAAVQPPAPPSLVVSVALAADEVAFCQRLLDQEHALGAASPAGHRLWQIVRRAHDLEPVAVLLWAAGALHLKDRDAWIGWDGMRRSQRLGLIVNNSRFLILDKTRQPNLASQAMGAALRALPGQWQQIAGYPPLLAEAFTDLESHNGTSYKASNWIPLGLTKGFERHRADFYVLHERPKKLWVYPLHDEARELLCAADLPAEYAPAQIAPSVRSPLKMEQMRSLMDVFSCLDDPRRRQSRRYSLPLLLMLVSLGLLCGAATLSDVVRQVQLLSQPQRKSLGLRRRKGKEYRGVPCYNAFRGMLHVIDPGQLEELLARWLCQHEGQLPRTLAMDGKDLGKKLGIIVSLINTTAADQGEGKPGKPNQNTKSTKNGKEKSYDNSVTPPVAMRCGDTGHEIRLAQELLASPAVELVGAVVTADALHCQHGTLHQIVAQKGGDYFISLKDNQPQAAKYARDILTDAPFLPSPRKKDTDAS
jgi:Domain of unknown function (DUF4338)/DDE_Tnp_1-associated